MCWELSTMPRCSQHLAFQEHQHSQAWGVGSARPIKIGSERLASCIVLVAPPVTIRVRKTTIEGTNILKVNYAMVLFTESSAVVLPPDTTSETGNAIALYRDPPSRPGMHRDQFGLHARRMVGELLVAGFRMTERLLSLVPIQYAQQVAAARAAAAQAATEAATAVEGVFEVESILWRSEK